MKIVLTIHPDCQINKFHINDNYTLKQYSLYRNKIMMTLAGETRWTELTEGLSVLAPIGNILFNTKDGRFIYPIHEFQCDFDPDNPKHVKCEIYA